MRIERAPLTLSLSSVGDGVNAAVYGYLPKSSLMSNIVFRQNGTTRMTTTKNYDNLNRLPAIQSSAGVSPAAAFGNAWRIHDQSKMS